MEGRVKNWLTPTVTIQTEKVTARPVGPEPKEVL